ncbi:MAG TPA: M36 family metallopeptidase, partial [Bryobacteraceae bacterium]|nr:M36 family metallopeptidase [Bryobacteraceae bacterium]
MGEAWSDYVALEMLHPEGLNPALSYVLGEYAFQQMGSGSRTRPYSTDMNINSLTFADYGRVADIGLEEHLDGEIWVEALWEARANFMNLYGEKEGRKRMMLNVIEGLKLQPPRASMIEARDAILLANRANFKGAGEQELWSAFAKRGLGVLAMSSNGDSSYVVASNESGSDRAVIRFHSQSYVPNELVRIVLYDRNNTSPTALVQLTTSHGDLENVTLRRRGAAYEGSIWTANDAVVRHRDEALDTIPSDVVSVFYVDQDTGGGKPELIMVNAPVQPEYTFTGQPQGPAVVSGTERALFQAPAGGRDFLQNARVTLPFNFRFFDRTYRVMWVSGNGMITFGGPNPTFCNDWDSAGSVPAIAPMWTEIFYGGQAQQAENVYFSTAANSVTVRWAGETPYTGEPINFSAVLYDDGRIRFQYGEGNNNLVSTPIFGCSTNTPVVGLSAGRDTYQIRYGLYDGFPNLNRAPAVLIDPPFNPSSDPEVRIETPEMNGRYKGVLTVRGIAYDAETRIT